MLNKIKSLSKIRIHNISLVILSTIFGIFAGPIIERIAPPLFDQANLSSIVFILVSTSIIILVIVSSALWKSTQISSELIATEILALTRTLGQQARLVHYNEAYQEGAKWVLEAKKEIRILTAYAYEFDWEKDKEVYDQQRLESPSRLVWFDALYQGIKKASENNLRFIRIVEVPKNRKLLQAIKQDELFFRDCKLLAEIGKSTPERACLRVTEPFITNTFILIDGTKLFLEFDIHDPDTRQIHAPFVLLAVDPTGVNFQELLRFHQKLESISRLITSLDK